MIKDSRFKEIYKRQFLSDFFLLTDVEAYIANMAYIEDMIHFGFSRGKNTMELAGIVIGAIKGKKRFNVTEQARRQLAKELMSCTLNFNGDNKIEVYSKLENGKEILGEINVRIESSESDKIILISTSGNFVLYDETGEEHDCTFDPKELNKMVYDEYEGRISPDIEINLGNMVNIKTIKKGDKVHYVPEHYKKEDKFENGIVEGIAPNGGVFVVYNCGGEWSNFDNYIAVNTRPEDLFIGWK